jgi:hypothetical protein
VRKTVLLLLIVGILLVSLSLVGCGESNSSSSNNQGVTNNEPSGDANNQGEQNENIVQVSKENPMVVNEDNNTISVYATVNGKYLVEPTIHGLNELEGSVAPKALFVTNANTLEFHDALINLGATPGNNLDLSDDSKGKYVEGDDLKVSITWDGANKEYDISEVIIDSQGKPFAFKFGGNYDLAKEKYTGCMLCLESCPIGIVSNSAQTFAEGVSEFRGNKDILPSDGTPVFITYKLN